jgi:hypothetical protein
MATFYAMQNMPQKWSMLRCKRVNVPQCHLPVSFNQHWFYVFCSLPPPLFLCLGFYPHLSALCTLFGGGGDSSKFRKRRRRKFVVSKIKDYQWIFAKNRWLQCRLRHVLALLVPRAGPGFKQMLGKWSTVESQYFEVNETEAASNYRKIRTTRISTV